jgi:endonuclease/exonuclease/phosphatase family metal-dependent hydrolase
VADRIRALLVDDEPLVRRGIRVFLADEPDVVVVGECRDGTEALAAIRAERPDLVALQEVDVHWSARSGFADQATTLATALGMEMRFAPIYRIPDSAGARPPREFGVALLSRYPIVAFTNHPITRLSTQQENPTPASAPGFLDATVDVVGTRVRVLDTHLDFRRDPAVRARQVADMLAAIGEPVGPTLLLGDLNATPDAPELRPLFRRLRDVPEAFEGPDFTIPSAAPTRRIDYVLVSDGVEVRRAWVPATAASDHRPVVMDLVLSPGRR